MAGYSPRSSGSVNRSPRRVLIRVAARSSRSVAGHAGAYPFASPTCRAPASRSARTASPCASSWWCAAGKASRPSRSPGACVPSTCPCATTVNGSVSVTNAATRSASRSATSEAYSSNRYAVSRASHPPAS